MKKVTNIRSAPKVIGGFTFQIDSAIHLFLQNIKKCKYIAIEGENDITYYDDVGLHVAQAKASTNEEGINNKTHLTEIKKSLDSFEMSYQTKPIEYRIIFNYAKPISNYTSFDINSNVAVAFSSLNIFEQNKLNDYYDAKHHKEYKLTDTFYEHLPYFQTQYSNPFVLNELTTLVDSLKNDDIGVLIDENYIFSRWFEVINNNGVNESEMLTKDELAGHAFNYLNSTNPKLNLYLKHRNDKFIKNGCDNNEIDKIFKRIEVFPVSITMNNKVRSWLFDNKVLIDDDYDKLDDVISNFCLEQSLLNEIPQFISVLTRGFPVYELEIFQRYVAMIIFNTNLIDKVKGEFGYEN